MSLKIQFKQRDTTLIILPSGRLDGLTVDAFEHQTQSWIDQEKTFVIIDFKNLSYISSAGLRALLILAKSLQQHKARFALCSLSPQIREIFEISGFDQIIAIHEDCESALAKA